MGFGGIGGVGLWLWWGSAFVLGVGFLRGL